MQLNRYVLRLDIVNFKKVFPILLGLFLLILAESITQACSMYKVSFDGKTMVGCNHDAWETTPKIWFVNAREAGEYGAAFTGAREVSNIRTAPQSGMNTAGLVFSRLTSYYPKQNNPFADQLKITNEVEYLSGVLHKCESIAEVKKHIEQYDHSFFISDVFIYIDSSGEYLVVEPYKLLEGNTQNYVLANFCPSITDNDQARNIERYRNGEDYLNNHQIRSDLSFFRSLSDTMHVSRSRNGDGTLLTSIWDTKEGMVNLYFYHNYDSTLQFSLADELAKGDHTLNIPELFPINASFERLKSYKTPFNTPGIRFSLVFVGGFLMMFSILLGFSLIRNRNAEITLKSVILISVMNLILTAYLAILATNIYIYYFDAPYEHYSSSLISASSYTPFLLLLAVVPFTQFTLRHLKSVKTRAWIRAILLGNNAIYLMLIIGFGYWGLYSIWN